MYFKMCILKCLLLFMIIRTGLAGYGIGGHYSRSAQDENLQSDVSPPRYTPSYLKNFRSRKTSYGTNRWQSSGGTKTAGVKTASFETSGVKTSGYNSHYRTPQCSIPQYINNAHIECETIKGVCKIQCIPGFQLPNGQTVRSPKCSYEDGTWVWISQYPEYKLTQPCEPICQPECQNGGFCVAPEQCECTENYSGPQCQHETRPCLVFPPPPMNSHRSCSSLMCTISCMDGHQFPDGSLISNMVCREGQWTPTRVDWPAVPDCQPVCDPPCQNGGVCLSLNVCQCPAAFRGAQCQYESSACSVAQLGYNGGYSCKGDGESFSCELRCPPPAAFTSPPAPLYTCLYSTGRFEPQPIPQCNYGSNQVIIQGGSSQSVYHRHIHSSGQGRGDIDSATPGTFQPVSRRPHSLWNDSNESIDQEGGHYDTNAQNSIAVLTPAPGVCFTWGGAHYKTFDGQVYSFESPCRHVLVRDSAAHEFSVVVRHGGCRGGTSAFCASRISIFLQDKEYILSKDEEGNIRFSSTKRQIPIPARLPGLRVSLAAHAVVAHLEHAGASLSWDTHQLVQVTASESLWNRTEGLCGVLDGHKDTDLLTPQGQRPLGIATLADSWQLKTIGDICDDSPNTKDDCSKKSEIIQDLAERFCKKLLTKNKFQKCAKVMDISLLMDACQWDYCRCAPDQDPESCACVSVAVFARQCVVGGVSELRSWRDDETCPMNCTDGKVYKSCGPATQPSCDLPSAGATPAPAADSASCTEGCFCPEGLFIDEGRCVPKQQCPCRLRNRNFASGAVVPKGCNTCKCEAGEWTCTEVNCGARCGAVGDPHYTTFDGRHYDFMGKCSYHLLKGDNYSVDVENVACPGAISDAMNLASSLVSSESPSCTKAVTITHGAAVIKLKQRGAVYVNGVELKFLPARVDDIIVRAASSLFLIVELPNGIDVWWDTVTRVFVDVPGSFRDNTKGLCGTFNNNQKDDFLTPEGDVEQTAAAFVNKWKTREACDDVTLGDAPDTCRLNVQNKEAAEKYCRLLKGELFKECHWYVDVEPFYKDCLYDMCACAGDVAACLCPLLGAYATECASQGVKVDWRLKIKECELACGSGQSYQVCADSCTRTCSDVSHSLLRPGRGRGGCRPRCVEGCACPQGQAMHAGGECVPVGMCPCHYDGLEFPPGYQEVRDGKTHNKVFCTCTVGKWKCREATPEEILTFPRAADIRDKCSAADHLEFTTCEPAEPRTCKNMHLAQSTTTAQCRPGCQCQAGYVLEAVSKRCVLPDECPCHHGGRSYPDGHKRPEECNTCECKKGKWECSTRQCSGVCGAWGDSHFITFDGKEFDFQGVCTYQMAQGAEADNIFTVEIQNEPCGTTGATCAKSIILKVGRGAKEETVALTKHNPIPDTSQLEMIRSHEAGAFVFLDVFSLGAVLQWDKATRVYVKLDPKWKNRVKGLCGNYNGDERDDFQPPSGGGMAEASALLFADSWRLKPNCPPATPIQEYCEERPFRKEWATSACGALLRPPFTACHSEVPPADYVRRCERDACACDSGGDCECVCIALATYSQLCAARGVVFKWRSKDVCPCQCDEAISAYEPCISACPEETCENTLDYSGIKKTCQEDTCVEGCKLKKKCEPGWVYTNSTLAQCVQRATCRPPCMTLPDGRVVLEGETLEEDECHTCRCSRRQRVCSGRPCSTVQAAESTTPSASTPPTPTSVTSPELSTAVFSPAVPVVCTAGWSPWVSGHRPVSVAAHGREISIEREDIPSFGDLVQSGSPGEGACRPDNMSDIECRPVGGNMSTGDPQAAAACSLDRGFTCRAPAPHRCPDYEIRVFCRCDQAPPPSLDRRYPQCSDAARPNHEHPTDCHKFYQCAPGSGPPEHPHLVEKTCGADMWYNPDSMICDWPDNVKPLRPFCADAVNVHPIPLSIFPDTAEGGSVFVGTMQSPTPPAPATTYTPSTSVPTAVTDSSTTPPLTTLSSTAHPSTTEEFTTLHYEKSTTESACAAGEVWAECAVPCGRLCHGYAAQLRLAGRCVRGELCEPGCIPEDVANVKCEPGSLWRDMRACVPKRDCTCADKSGGIVKPGAVKHESCLVCQCHDNAYSCDESQCVSKTAPPSSSRKTDGQGVIVVVSTTTPPPLCTRDGYKKMLWDGKNPVVVTASSSANDGFSPTNAVLNMNKGAGSWTPAVSDGNQYIQAEFPRRQPLYGVVLQGSGLFSEYVTSYHVLYGDDGQTFSYVQSHDHRHMVFFGSRTDSREPVEQMFPEPVEAKFLRVQPLTWHEGIAVRFDVIGCGDETTTTAATTTTATTATAPPPAIPLSTQTEQLQCTEPLGFSKGLPYKNVQVSSGQESVKNLGLNQENAWRPTYNAPGEWIFFDFTGPRNVTGIVTKGGKTGWVKSYKVLYTPDHVVWSPVTDEHGSEKVFSGNNDSDTEVKNMFAVPVYMQFIKILPLEWDRNIEMRVEPLGCYLPYTAVEAEPLCTERMGISKGLPLSNVQVSSEQANVKYLDLNQENAWRPTYSTPGEWIFFDFTGLRNVTGVITKGGKTGWVTSYKILYSPDHKSWSPITDDEAADRLFPANVDSDTEVTNMFPRPIHMQFMKILPQQWSKSIEMRVEPLGCFLPYPVSEQPDQVYTIPPEPSTASTSSCQLCPGLIRSSDRCDCPAHKSYFDGEECTTLQLCPCFVGLIPYPVGATYKSSACEDCTCKMGGVPDCVPAKCPKCAAGLARVESPLCECACAACPAGQRVCPTSEVCVPLDKWCDGVTDCPDDELECLTTFAATTPTPTTATATATTTTTAATTTPEPAKQCAEPSCPAGYKVSLVSRRAGAAATPAPDSLLSLPPPRPRKTYNRYYTGTKGGPRASLYSGAKTRYPGTKSSSFSLSKPMAAVEASEKSAAAAAAVECPQYKCVSSRKLPQYIDSGAAPAPPPCSVPACPPHYTLRLERDEAAVSGECPRYTCVPPPPRDAVCNVTGRTFNTFDGTEYKYDICDHLLARDSHGDKWSVIIQKNCTQASGCARELLIVQDGDNIRALPSLHVEYNGYPYTVDQTKKIGLDKETFLLSRNGDVLFYVSKKYAFWVAYNMQGDVKIGVQASLSGAVDGLCGYYDGRQDNDRRLPAGSLVRSTEVFGDAWARPELPPGACEARVCPLDLQAAAWDMCSVITEQTLSACGAVLELDKWRTRCLERVCECAQSGGGAGDAHACLCQALQGFVVECQAADRTVDLQGWRTETKCPAECPAPLVHHDCYRRRCEPACAPLLSGGAAERCVAAAGVCFPGCFCPEGKLRLGDDCVDPRHCRDCECDGKGTPAKYTTFERADLPFSGNCTYIAARDNNDKADYKFQVFVTNSACASDPKLVCAEAVHVIQGPHTLHVQKNHDANKLDITVDGVPVYKSVKTDWLLLEILPGKDVSILLPEVQLEVTTLLKNMDFNVRVPSYLYANKTEGLCGSCGGFSDVLIAQNGTATTDVQEYGLSWLAGETSRAALDIRVEEGCVEKPKNECLPLPPDQDPCFKILDPQAFGMCHPVVEPGQYVAACQQDACLTGRQVGLCASLEQYATECRRAGLCVDWRSADLCPYPCEGDLVYKPCGLGCPLTCDNYDELSRNPSKCAAPSTEGCFCPEGKVAVNNSCIEPSKCFPCDAERQHYAGDEWEVDACTRCACLKSEPDNAAHVACTQVSCAPPACASPLVAERLPARPTQCCAEYICVPQATESPQCDEPQPISCGFGQELKLERTDTGCKKFSCQCAPASECEPVPAADAADAPEPGVERAVDRSGCCPRLEMRCRPETCPPPAACPPPRLLRPLNVTGKCCPEHQCVVPEDKCIVSLEWESKPEGGEIQRAHPETILKSVSEVWTDGACRSCRCVRAEPAAPPTPQCAVTACPPLLSSEHVVLEQRSAPYQCCPVPHYVACRHGATVFKAGENYTAPDEPCVSYECVATGDNALEKRTSVQKCDADCKPGWELVPAAKASGACCGRCEPVACAVDGSLHAVGSTWQSSDNCTTYRCDRSGTEVSVHSQVVSCPSVPEQLSRDYELSVTSVPGECCPRVEALACRVGDQIYREGETWVGGDACVNVSCARAADGRLARVEAVTSCHEDCPRGSAYRPSASPGVCCGGCRPTACVDGDTLRPPNSTWKSDDNCTTMSCTELDQHQLVISMHREDCPDVSGCPADNLYTKGCCQHCKPTAMSHNGCSVEEVAAQATVRTVRLVRRGGEECTNTEPVRGFTACSGGCPSRTRYNSATGLQDSECTCCRATRLASLTVTLQCAGGSRVQHRVAVPAKCACEPCS